MTRTRLIILSVAALAFALYETSVACVHSDVPNWIWAGFGWICVIFVAGIVWETQRKK